MSASTASSGSAATPTLAVIGRSTAGHADLGDRGAHLLGDVERAVAVGVGQQHDELLAAVATGEVARAHDAPSSVAHGGEHLVAAGVAEACR